jgi:hypothetical protein
MLLAVGPGDVLAVASTAAIFSRMIALFEGWAGKPTVSTHVVIVTHQDKNGNWVGIQATPRGVGVCVVDGFLADPRTRTNHAQPRTDDRGQSQTFLASCALSLGIPYDWIGVAEDIASTLHLHDLSHHLDEWFNWERPPASQPSHVVCSSLAAELYGRVGWAHPDIGVERVCEPGDWVLWCDQRGWLRVSDDGGVAP